MNNFKYFFTNFWRPFWVLAVLLLFTLYKPPTSAISKEPTLIISAVNPGYSVDGQTNVDEFIELKNLTPDPVELTGLSLVYTNSSGNTSTLYEFPDGAIMDGEFLLLRFAKSPEVVDTTTKLADDLYSKTLAFTGQLSLMRDSTELNSLCWTGKESCYKAFKSSSPTILAYTDEESEDGDFSGAEANSEKYQHLPEYRPHFDPSKSTLLIPEIPSAEASSDEEPETSADSPEITESPSPVPASPTPPTTKAPTKPETPEKKVPLCDGLIITEVLSYYSESPSEQFIELYNSGQTSLNLAQCNLKYKSKTYPTGEQTLPPGSYFVFYPPITLTKNPTSFNTIAIVDINGFESDSVDYPHGQKKSTSYALLDDNSWVQTYRITPSAPNEFQEFRDCPAGKTINPETGNCVTVSPIKTTIEECPAGKYRNPATGRCKTIEDESVSECKEGYERNPETNRCRKIKDSSAPAYPLIPETGEPENSSSFTALWTILAVVALGLVYIIFQFRPEIAYFCKKLSQKFRKRSH